MPNDFEQAYLTPQYHDQPERHRYGSALFEPGTPTTITPLTTQAAAVGTSDAPARGDHTHGITGITIPAIATANPSVITPYTTQAAAVGSSVKYAKEDHVHGVTGEVWGSNYYDFRSASSSTDVVGNGAWQVGAAEAGVLSVVNPSSSGAIAKLIVEGVAYPQASVAADQVFALHIYYSSTLDGSTPATPAAGLLYWDTFYCNNGFNGSFKINEFYTFFVGAGQTLKLKFKLAFFAGANVTLADHAIQAMAWL